MIGTRFVDNSPEALATLAKRKKQALDKAGLIIGGRAKELTPVDTNRLRSSITHKRVSDNEAHIGTNVEYAIYVHEDLDARHRIGQAKYLETAVSDTQNEVKREVRDTLKHGAVTQ